MKFFWRSKNEHGVHSPFVFELVTKCFYDRKTKHEYEILKSHRKYLLENKNFIEVNDFGAGSKIFNSNKRQISQIVKTAGITSKRAELLFRIVHYFQPENVLEIGTSLGLATVALSLGNQKSKITTLEGCENTMAIAKNNCQLQHLDNIKFVTIQFSDFIKAENLKATNYNLIYFDGNHSKQATLDYFELLLPTISNDTVWIFDDIHWSHGMQEAWKIIKTHPKVTVTIDTFQWGIIFFRIEQEKEHFVIRT